MNRDDQFLALPEEAVQLDIGLQVDYGFNPDMFYQYGVLAAGSFNGVFGQAGGGNGRGFRLRAGVVGWSDGQPGVLRWSRHNNGVDAESVSGPGLSAVSFWGPAVNAVSGATGVRALGQSVGVSGEGFDDSGVVGMSAAAGPPIPQPVTTAGVVGTSASRHGVIGTSTAGFGVYGFSTNAAGILGEAGPAAYAGVFNGKVAVNGLFSAAQVTAQVKQAIAPFPDGTQRILVCMESPEHWFEDFGAAKLKGGRVVVKLDADFAKVIKRGDYHVFFTPKGDCRGLHVRRQGGVSFEVRESQGGKSSIAFSYRIIGRRKDIKSHRRFAKFDMQLPIPPRTRPARRGKIPPPTPAGLRAFAARMETQARTKMPKRGRKRKGSVR